MERIVIVDDDLSLCHFLKRTLSQKGYDVSTCHTGGDASEVIHKQEANVVLLDNKLPDRTGLEILKEMKQNHPKMPVIVMTAFGTTDTVIEAMRLGAFDYILKPFELEEISELVAKGLEANKLMKRAVAIPATGKPPSYRPIYPNAVPFMLFHFSPVRSSPSMHFPLPSG